MNSLKCADKVQAMQTMVQKQFAIHLNLQSDTLECMLCIPGYGQLGRKKHKTDCKKQNTLLILICTDT